MVHTATDRKDLEELGKAKEASWTNELDTKHATIKGASLDAANNLKDRSRKDPSYHHVVRTAGRGGQTLPLLQEVLDELPCYGHRRYPGFRVVGGRGVPPDPSRPSHPWRRS